MSQPPPPKPYVDRAWKRALFWVALAPIMYAPRWLRYRFADFVAWLCRDVIKYRRGVIDGNLAIAFPERSDVERAAIRDGFYTNFGDLIAEQIWAFGAGESEVLAMYEAPPALAETFARHRAAGRPVMLAAGHHNNYELGAAALGLHIGMELAVIYSPMANKFFDHRARESRARFGMRLWPRAEVRARVAEWAAQRACFVIGFAFDQSPHPQRRKYWLPFFGRRTAVHKGLEAYARELSAAVVYASAERLGRGRYRLHFTEICEDASALPEGEALLRATGEMEATIRREPAGWFWSHRRWKLDPERDRVAGDADVGALG